jgi:hypothetical protein
MVESDLIQRIQPLVDRVVSNFDKEGGQRIGFWLGLGSLVPLLEAGYRMRLAVTCATLVTP